jgi:hypothetical protein
VTDSRNHKSKTLQIMSITMFLSGCGPQFVLKQDPARIYTSETHVEVSHINVGSRVTLTPEILDLAELGCRANGFAAEYRGVYRNNEYSGEEVFTFNCVLPQNKAPIYFNRDEEWLLAEQALADRNHASVQKTPKVSSSTDITSSSNTQIVESPDLEFMRKRLIQLEAEKDATQQAISQDTQSPLIRITFADSNGARGNISGVASDNTGIAEVLINGEAVAIDSSGRFNASTFIPAGGINVQITAYDLKGLSTTETIRLEREVTTQVAKISFDRLNPTTRQVKSNRNAIALIVGVAEYEKTAGAEYADRDAQVFYDYANLKLGIPRERIQTLVNDKADVVGLLSGINKWLKRSVKQGESDVYIFFAGHGLASDDGDTAYLIPYDGAPDFLERTAISRDEVFREVSSVNPRSVTVFLDTCYSGDTRGETRLIAGRPLSIKLQEQSLPTGFTVLTAAGGDQIAKPLEEAQHGMFSYFLMKGMEGGADSNSDNQITARELHSYVRENVVQQSGGSQVPELQGDGERVLVRFR